MSEETQGAYLVMLICFVTLVSGAYLIYTVEAIGGIILMGVGGICLVVVVSVFESRRKINNEF